LYSPKPIFLCIVQTTDSQLWESFKKGDQETFSLIYEQYIDELLIYGYRITNNKQLIKDSIQDLFLGLWNSRERISGTDSIRFYLFRSLRNRILRNIEKQKEISVSDISFYHNVAELSIEDSLIDSEQESQTATTLRNAIAKLSKRQQEVIQLRYYHNFSNPQICEIMHISNQSVRNLLSKSLLQLRESLELLGWLLICSIAIYL
jgi:RNA polymerase sigma factor (sigma-70 family)